jgi:hypothetical protein
MDWRNGAAAPLPAGRFAAVGESAKRPVTRLAKKTKRAILPGPSISCARPVQNGLKESSALLFLPLLLYVQ